jgi:hypothetical protein
MHRVVCTHIEILKEGYKITASAIFDNVNMKQNSPLGRVLQGEPELGMPSL